MSRLSGLKDGYDVLVVGGGGAGLMAAVEAAETGASVLLVERQPEIGGSTAMAVGALSAAGTALQKAAGIEDSVDAHFQDYLKFIEPGRDAGEYDLELTRMLVELAPSVVERMVELGVELRGPQPEPPHTRVPHAQRRPGRHCLHRRPAKGCPPGRVWRRALALWPRALRWTPTAQSAGRSSRTCLVPNAAP